MNDTLKSDVIETLMQIEMRSNQEMTRCRNSVINSSSTTINCAGANGCRPSALSQLDKLHSTDNLNELSRTALIVMVGFVDFIKLNKYSGQYASGGDWTESLTISKVK